MTNDNVLPENFDGVFRFTNFTNEEFRAKWNSVEYTFPPMSTTPIIIPSETPLQVQQIRKKFARELAVQEFYKTSKFKDMDSRDKGQNPAIYTDNELAPLVQRCLEPLPVGKAKAKALPKDSEENYRKDSKGKNISRILDESESLTKEGSAVIE